MTVAGDFSARVRASRDTARKLVVFRLPEDLLTIVAVSAKTIESFPEVAVDEIDDAETIAAALDAIERSLPVADARPLDARTALLFSNAAGDRILRVYKGSFASRGQIDDETCAFDEPALHAWLTARYPKT